MGRAPCCDKANVRRGPWSPEEDEVLRNYIEKFGTGGNWITLPHKAGLNRCGKSCRLRWLNYLRPDIKHGGFTEEEDGIICGLYKKLGSRWSIIASHLRGRTDNDVKNYWNSKLKKKMMAREANPAFTNATSNPIHCSPSPTPTPTPLPALLTTIKCDSSDISMSSVDSIFALTQDCHKFYSEPSRFSTTSLMEQREFTSVNMSGQFMSPSEEVSVTSSTVTVVDNGSSDSYKHYWSAGGAGADDSFLSELDFGCLGDLLGGHGCEEKLGEVSPYSFWASAEAMPQGPFQSVTYS